MKTEEMAILLLQEADYQNMTCSKLLKTADLSSIKVPGWSEDEFVDLLLILCARKRCVWDVSYEDMENKEKKLSGCKLFSAVCFMLTYPILWINDSDGFTLCADDSLPAFERQILMLNLRENVAGERLKQIVLKLGYSQDFKKYVY